MTTVLDLQAPKADHRVAYGPHPLHFGDLRLPEGEGPHPLVLAIHGGFWRAQYDLEHLGHLCAALTREGFATWSIEYRRVGHEGGGFPGTLEDVGRAADFIPQLAEKFPVRMDKVVVIGHSAGGHLALWLGGRHRVPASSSLRSCQPFRPGGVVGLAAVSDLALSHRLNLGDGIVDAFMGGPPEARREAYAAGSPIQLLPFGIPQRLVHGADDDVVPLSVSQAFVQKAQAVGERIDLRALPATGHYELIDPRSTAWPSVRDAVRALSES